MRGASCIYCGQRVAARVSHGEVAKPVSHTGPGAFFTRLYFCYLFFFFFFFLNTFQFWSETNIAIPASWRGRSRVPLTAVPRRSIFMAIPCASIRRVQLQVALVPLSQLRYWFRPFRVPSGLKPYTFGVRPGTGCISLAKGFAFRLGWWKILAFSLTLRKCTIFT